MIRIILHRHAALRELSSTDCPQSCLTDEATSTCVPVGKLICFRMAPEVDEHSPKAYITDRRASKGGANCAARGDTRRKRRHCRRRPPARQPPSGAAAGGARTPRANATAVSYCTKVFRLLAAERRMVAAARLPRCAAGEKQGELTTKDQMMVGRAVLREFHAAHHKAAERRDGLHAVSKHIAIGHRRIRPCNTHEQERAHRSCNRATLRSKRSSMGSRSATNAPPRAR